MDDATLLTAVRQPYAGAHLDTPLEDIVRHGRLVRGRRRILRMLTGVLAAGAGAALTVTLLPAGRSASHVATVHTAAWTVATQPHGVIKVTVRELGDPAGLQAVLRADGFPVSVVAVDGATPADSLAQGNPACRQYTGAGSAGLVANVARATLVPGATALTLDRSALPANTGLQMGAKVMAGAGGTSVIRMMLRLVQASTECTGS